MIKSCEFARSRTYCNIVKPRTYTRRDSRARVVCLAEQRSKPEPKRSDAAQPSTSSAPPDNEVLSQEEIAKLAALRRTQLKAQNVGVLQGALQEAQLVEWPTLGKASVDTVLVIVIVAGTSALLFGLNTLLTELANAVY